MEHLRLITQLSTQKCIHIADNDMIHITWKHATIRLNVTGFIYLIEFMSAPHTHTYNKLGFNILGTPDDGYQLWVQDVGILLSFHDYTAFKALLQDGLTILKQSNTAALQSPLPGFLKLTAPDRYQGQYSVN